MITAEIQIQTLQNEVNALAELQNASTDEATSSFIFGAIVALAWLGGSPISPSIRAQMLLKMPEVLQ
jgi:hypothetical protein